MTSTSWGDRKSRGVGQRNASHQSADASPVVGCASLTHPTRSRVGRADFQEAEVGRRFDRLHERFKSVVRPDDVRLSALIRALGPLDGLRVLDLGCGKGRFAARLTHEGAQVIGLDISSAMLGEAFGLARVKASARRLPFADESFDAIVAVEVFEHLPDVDGTLNELARVLRPGGRLAIVDKNAGSLNARRPWVPSLVVKWLDTRRGRWMYPAKGSAQERWFWPRGLARRLSERFEGVRYEYIMTPDEARSWLFRRVPSARLMTLWTARARSVENMPQSDAGASLSFPPLAKGGLGEVTRLPREWKLKMTSPGRLVRPGPPPLTPPSQGGEIGEAEPGGTRGAAVPAIQVENGGRS
jgi:ubiquinone/menaquinone biosynthesis C-methylase UbiE